MHPTAMTRKYLSLSSHQETALKAIASVVITHLDGERKDPTHGSTPLLIQVDGPGNIDLVDVMTTCLQRGEGNRRAAHPSDNGALSIDAVDRPECVWGVIRFDAWQYQRVAPPWWWLVMALDRQLREQFRERGAGFARRKLFLDYLWRSTQFLKDLVPVAPVALVALMLWFASGQLAMSAFLKWTAGLVGGLTTIAVFLWSASNAVRRLLLASPVGGKAMVRTKDPMAELQARYEFLIRSSDRPLVLVIDNLDRCHADYVVELLEGLQTALRNPGPEIERTRLVAVLVPAARAWLCDSYVPVYQAFQDAMRQPGRPFGLGFVDRVFDLALRLPPAAPAATRVVAQPDLLKKVEGAGSEAEIRRLVVETETKDPLSHPICDLRLAAVRRLAKLEVDSGYCVCLDTRQVLKEVVDAVGPSPAVVRQLRASYCVHRTSQLMGGHPIEDGRDAIRRLALWTLLDLRWPLLTEHLARHPGQIELLKMHQAPGGIEHDLALVFSDPEAARIACIHPELTQDSIRMFTAAARPEESGSNHAKLVSAGVAA